MTAYDFNLVGSSSFAFDADEDTISFGTIDAATLTITDDGTNTTITDGTTTVTLEGFRPFQIDTGNFLFTGTNASEVKAGDNDDTTITDDSTNDTITEAQADKNNLFIGFGGDDTITSGDGDVVIFGGSGIVDTDDGDDELHGGTGNQVIYGNAGDDIIDTFAPDTGNTTTVFGGADDDSITTGAGTGNAVLYGNSGDDTIDADAMIGEVTIFGGNGIADSTDGDDVINTGDDGSTTVYANAGNDLINIDNADGGLDAGESVTAYAGTGNDTIDIDAASAGSSAIVAFGNTDNDVINLGAHAGDATIYGGNGIADSSDGDDTITTGSGESIVYANAGDDSIVSDLGAAFETTVYGGLGADTISVDGADAATAKLFLGDGDATGVDVINYDIDNGEAQVTISGFDGTEDKINITLDGSRDAANLTFTRSTNTITDGSNATSLRFADLATDLTGTNFVVKNENNDANGSVLATSLFATAAGTLTGGDGDDQLIGGNNGDTFVAGAGTDNLNSGSGADTFQFDSAELAAGDTIDGGAGNDTIELTDNNATNDLGTTLANTTNVEAVVFSGTGTAGITVDATASTAGVETIDASTATGVVTFDDSAGTFASDLFLTTGSDDDNLTLDSAIDVGVTLNGGDDQVTLSAAGLLEDDDTINGGSGSDTIQFTGGAETLTDDDFENLTSIEGLIFGTAANNIDLGANASAAGIATVTGGTGGTGQTIDAGDMTTDVSITGGSSTDTITGGTGDDTLQGGLGVDSLTGGAGDDTFDYGGNTNAGTDIITAFVAGSGNDVYAIDESLGDVAGAYTTGNTVTVATATAVNANANVAMADTVMVDTLAGITSVNGTAGLVSYAVDSATGDLYYDADGNWTAGSVQLSNVTTLTGTFVASNFDIVA
ncbi:MAG: calcium-binding protein [Rickettsiales bacterium]|nr:calcium-binding protein [Rickettsiales bacterium]